MSSETKENVNDDEISINDVIIKLKSGIKYLKTKWPIILIAGIVGGLIGIGYAHFKKPVYTANCTFVLDEGSKGGGLSQYAGLASLAGVDIGGGSTTGLFQGDNIIELYKSRLMIEKALLSKADFNGKSELLIDRYINFNNLRKQWREKDKIGDVNFNGDPDKFNRTQDSIINDLVELFNKKVLSVTRPDKKLSIINVEVSTTDESFSKDFTDNLVQVVNNFYIVTKTKKANQDVHVLQRQADSIRIVLNSSISGVASAIDAAPNANPLLLSLRVPSQRKQIDVQASTAIYSEVVKNLEVSKMILRQETPLIQVVDAPEFPLKVSKIGHVKGLMSGFFAGLILMIIILSVNRIFKTSNPI